MVSAVERCGFREYYNPPAGRGLGARGFGYATLVVDLLADSGNSGLAPQHPSGRAPIIAP